MLLQRSLENDSKFHDPHFETTYFKYDYEKESTEPVACPVVVEPDRKVVTFSDEQIKNIRACNPPKKLIKMKKNFKKTISAARVTVKVRDEKAE